MNRYNILKYKKLYTLFASLLCNLCMSLSLAAQNNAAVGDTTTPVIEKPIPASDTVAKPSGIKNADTLLPFKNGLSARKIVYMPRLILPQNDNDTVHIVGVVIVAICIDKQGAVISAKNVLGKSTVTDEDSIKAAIENALKYRFAPSDEETEDCRELKFNFKYM